MVQKVKTKWGGGGKRSLEYFRQKDLEAKA
jgi:hypothetical protein